MLIRSNPDLPQDELFRSRLEDMIDMSHLFVKLGQGTNWRFLIESLANTTQLNWLGLPREHG